MAWLVLVLSLFCVGFEVLEASFLYSLIICLDVAVGAAVVKSWWLLQANGFMFSHANANAKARPSCLGALIALVLNMNHCSLSCCLRFIFLTHPDFQLSRLIQEVVKGPHTHLVAGGQNEAYQVCVEQNSTETWNQSKPVWSDCGGSEDQPMVGLLLHFFTAGLQLWLVCC